MFPYLALMSLVAFAGGIQNTHQKFSVPAFTPVLFNLSLIIAAVFVAPYYDMPIYVLAWGVLLAGFLQLLIQISPLMNIDRLPVPKIDFKNKRVDFFGLATYAKKHKLNHKDCLKQALEQNALIEDNNPITYNTGLGVATTTIQTTINSIDTDENSTTRAAKEFTCLHG